MFTVYLIHFEKKLHHAKHYLGYTYNLDNRLSLHASGNGAKLIKAINQAGIEWQLSRVWSCNLQSEARKLEKKLKSWKKSKQFCPLCNPDSAMQWANYDELQSK